MGTLEKMIAAGEADEELTTPPAEEAEYELELDGDETPPEGEEDAGEITLEGDSDDEDEPGKPGKRVDLPKRTLSKLRRTRREARETVVERDTEISELKQQLGDLRQATLKKPSYVDFSTDAEYEAALLQYHAIAGPTPVPGQMPARPNQPAPAAGPDFTDDVNAHYDRAEALGVNPDKFIAADRTTRETLGEGITDAIISSVGEGSEKAIMLIGSRPSEMLKVQQMFQQDPSGLKVIAHLTRLAAKATVGKRTVSGAPAPSRTPTGGGQAPQAVSAYNKRMNKAEKAGDAGAMVKIRREARAAGVTL
jgi:hypothetical protein